MPPIMKWAVGTTSTFPLTEVEPTIGAALDHAGKAPGHEFVVQVVHADPDTSIGVIRPERISEYMARLTMSLVARSPRGS